MSNLEPETIATHDHLVKAAARWLGKTCSVVATEIASDAGEQPDAIGWRGRLSTLIECKVTRSDFTADASKRFRVNPTLGIGLRRYFLTPPALISADDLPPNWGLLELTGKRIKVVRESGVHQVDNRNEILVLVSLLRRIGSACPPGVSIRCYTLPTGNRSTLGVSDEAECLE